MPGATSGKNSPSARSPPSRRKSSQSSLCTATNLLVPSMGCLSTSCTFPTSLCCPYAILSSIRSNTTRSSSSGTPPLLFGLSSSLARCVLVRPASRPQPHYNIQTSPGTWRRALDSIGIAFGTASQQSLPPSSRWTSKGATMT